MQVDQIPGWLFWIPPVWIAAGILLSVIVRRGRGKAIIPRVPPNALYADRSASGGMASRCLIVAVTPETLVVTPRFPFNLMFLPEIYRLEHNIPRADIVRVSAHGSRRSNVTIACRDGRELKLKLRDPEAFVATLAQR